VRVYMGGRKGMRLPRFARNDMAGAKSFTP